MIVGVGIDIVSIEDIERSLKDNKRFLERVYRPGERLYCESRSQPLQHFAGLFAAKEAMMKALGTGWAQNIQWNNIEVIHQTSGKPEIVLHDSAKECADLLKATTIHISITHNQLFANAVAILETGPVIHKPIASI